MTRRMLLAAPALLAASLLAAVACSKDGEKPAPAPAPVASAKVALKPGATLVVADDKGCTPSAITVAKGATATLTFLRTTDETCATAVVFPELKLKKDLPLNQPVDVEIPTGEARKLAFQCGMGMFKSAVVVQ